ncbi:hypothetical protein LJK87_13770 [Paenibacillus sp. P25]|nr:hypothetical protein LJK87_13770 [Paenibacillus sp. P25]
MKRTVIGAVLILLGAAIYLNQGHPVDAGTIFGYYWPSMFVIPLGLFFHWLFFSITGPRAAGLLIPGGILFTAGIVCQIAMLFGELGRDVARIYSRRSRRPVRVLLVRRPEQIPAHPD